MTGSIRDWMLGITLTLLCSHLLEDWVEAGSQASELRCTRLTVVDARGRPRVVLDGSPSATSVLMSVLDIAGTPRLTVGVEQAPDDKIVDSTVRLRLLDHEGLAALDLVEDGNHHHGRSSRLELYSPDLEGNLDCTAMLGTQALQGWPILEFSPKGGGSVVLGLGECGIPSLRMRQSPIRRGVLPVLVEERRPDEIGNFWLGPGSKSGQLLIGEEQEVLTRSIAR